MAQPVGQRTGFGRWVEHFAANEDVHMRVDAAIDFDADCSVLESVRTPLIASIRRFQLGESGEGRQLIRNAERAGDPQYVRAIELSSPRRSSTPRCCCACSDTSAAHR